MLIPVKPHREWPSTFVGGMVTALVVNLVTALIAARQTHKQTGDALVSLNAVSHWVWGDHAAYHRSASAKYTLTGFIIHHLASFFWAAIYEFFWGKAIEKGVAARALAGAGVVAAASYLGDYYIAPKRLTPGWDLRLRRRRLWPIYMGIAIALPLRGLARHALSRQRH